MPNYPAVRSCKGHIDHLDTLIGKWTYRRDQGYAVPSKEILTSWILQAESERKQWVNQLDWAEKEENRTSQIV